ncbi:META domain-containing protein [Pseudoalteromonas ulvae]|uniref:DUF306 domain-containing protein n=1 Tax=Pseudoalteromonas ulvae TaxID=107327 RepID=A0A244CPI4_PSEDV|nr:META domain-containing protein [Pseudoalteromonas ulvae]OUL57523.1 hypothetical protein B1199_10650 [Pseudoalteromonas ulvae]
MNNSFFKSIILVTSIFSVATLLAGCTHSHANTDTHQATDEALTISVLYRDRSMLRPGSELRVTLEDVSKMDVAAEVLSTTVMSIDSAPPYIVSLPYQKNKIKSNMRYNVRAQISNQGQLIYTSTQHYDPFNQVVSGPYSIQVERVHNRTPDVALTNTYWKAMTLGQQAVINQENIKELFLQLREGNNIRGFAGCNNFQGSFEQHDFALTFKQIASTMKMCADSTEQEQKMFHSLNETASYSIKGEHLTLLDKDQTVLATFQAMYF